MKQSIPTNYFSSLVPNAPYECLFNRFQELGLSMGACQSLESNWEDAVRRSLPSGPNYVKVHSLNPMLVCLEFFVPLENFFTH